MFDTAFLYDNDNITEQMIRNKIAEGVVKHHEMVITDNDRYGWVAESDLFHLYEIENF